MVVAPPSLAFAASSRPPAGRARPARSDSGLGIRFARIFIRGVRWTIVCARRGPPAGQGGSHPAGRERGANPPIAAFYERLRRAGKPSKLALTACVRKLVVTLNAMLRTGTAWKQA